MSVILLILLSMLKIGCFAFGGGYAIIALLENEFISKRNWIDHDEFLDVVAIAESTPGPIAINSATFIGYKTAGVWGSLFATVGVVLPSFVIISLIAYLLKEFADLKPVVYAFYGIRAGVLALVTKSLWTMYKKAPRGYVAMAISLLALICVAFAGVNALIVIILSALIGYAVSEIRTRRAK